MQLSIPLSAMKAASSGFSTRGGTLTSSLTLARNPQGPLEAATKGYIDTAITSIAATALDAGALSVERFPAFSGDVVKVNGGDQVNLANSGVTAGSYGKVNVDAKGRITAAYALSSDDIPSLNWTKIKTNIPTTLDGYGITNGLRKSGGTLTGFLLLTAPPTQSFHLASKDYADQTGGSGSKLTTGDLVRHFGTSLTGFLRCNGGAVNKASYPALYAVVGDQFGAGSVYPGSGKPWRNQYALNNTQDGDLGSWSAGTALPQAISQSQIVVTKSKVYLIAGYINNPVGIPNVYSANINSDGTLATWVAENSNFPIPLHSAQAVVLKNRVYILGGYSNTGSLNTIYYATINGDGTLGAWTLYSTLPTTLYAGQAFITSTRLYVLGGDNGSGAIGVYSTDIGSDGSLGTWVTETSLPVACQWAQVIVTNNRVYMFGNGTTTVITALIGSDGYVGTWSVSSSSLPAATKAAQAVVVNKRLYLIGGHNPDGTFNTYVFHAPINADGTIGTWVTGTALPDYMGFSQALVTISRLYLLGHQSANRVYSAVFTDGLNDYSGYYDGTITITNPTTFKLPDYTLREVDGFNYFIKY